MSTQNIILLCFILYTALIFFVMWLSSRRSSDNDAFFRGNRKSPWPVVAYGMLGASLSGVTFMSVPGGVYADKFTYMPLVFGYVLGYVCIAFILLPLYYKLNLTSIYSYLEKRFGGSSEKTGALFFILSRLLGSSLRMYLVVFVLYELVFRYWGIPFWVPAVVFIVLILLYTFRGGVKTVVWTDTLQTTFLLLAAVATIVVILKNLDINIPDLLAASSDEGYTRIWETDINHPKHFLKQIVSGAFITITMTGLDQDMMQKNLTCKNLRSAQKNVLTSSILFVVVNLIFLTLGAALIYYATHTPGIDLPVGADGKVLGDKIYPVIAQSMGGFALICFVLGIVAAGYSSADGTLTALTTTFCYDFLHFDKRDTLDEKQKIRYRKMVHVGFAMLYFLVIIAFRPFHNDSLINILFDIAGFTYGPLLGLYAFGLFTKWQVRDRWVPVVAVVCPVICYLLKIYSKQLFGGYQLGFELLLLNGLLTFIGLMLISSSSKKVVAPILVIAALFSISACSQYTVYSVKDNPLIQVSGGVVYALPKTQIRVDVTVEQRDISHAPFVAYAKDYLALSDNDIDTSYRIASIDLAGVNIADQDNYYYVKVHRGSLTVDNRHLLLAIGVENPVDNVSVENRQTTPPSIHSEAFHRAEYNLYNRADTFYTRHDAPGRPSMVSVRKDVRSLSQRAASAAERLHEIQTKQQELINGEYEGSYSAEAVQYLYAHLKQQEEQILAEFCGTVKRETVSFYIEPVIKRKEEFIDTVIWFSPVDGFIGNGDNLPSEAFPLILSVTMDNDLRSANRFVKYHTSGLTTNSTAGRTGTSAAKYRKRRNFRYRIPEASTVTLTSPVFSVSRQIPISQLGPVVELPRRRIHALFDANTLDLKYLDRK